MGVSYKKLFHLMIEKDISNVELQRRARFSGNILESVNTIALKYKIWYNNYMEITKEQFDRIASYLPRQRGNVSMSNLQFINAILYVMENGCKWRALPKSYGNWHTVYVRMNRWSKSGVLQRLFEALQIEGIIKKNTWRCGMGVSYKKLFHLMIEKDISNVELQRRARFSGNILTRLKRNSYVSLESIETICKVLDCKVDDILEFVPDGVQDGGNDDGK